MSGRTRRARVGLCLLLCAWAGACGDAADTRDQDRGPVAIRRPRRPPADWLATARMDYDPVDAPLAFTPAGELLVAHSETYSAGDMRGEACRGSGFYRLSRGGGRAEPLRTGARVCRGMEEPAAAPDGTWAVYPVPREPNNSVLVRVDLATGRVQTLNTGCSVYLQAPSVAPDGRLIAAVGLCRGQDQESYGLYILRPDGSGLREIVPGGVASAPAAWSPDGLRLVYERGTENPPAESLAIVGVDGSGDRMLGPGFSPAWSPDGQWIAFAAPSRRGNDWNLSVVRPDGAGRRVVFINRDTTTYFRGWGNTREGLPTGTPVWYPDSRSIAFARRYDAGTSIWRLDVQSGIVQRVTRPDR